MKNKLKRKLKKDQILFSAISVIKRQGYDQTTMEDISNELDMTKGSLYYYFKSKNDLMYQCHRLVLSLAIQDIEEAMEEGESADVILRKMVAIHIEYIIEERAVFNLLFDPTNLYEEAQLEPVLALRKSYASLFDEVIQKGIETQIFSGENPFVGRMIILGALNWIQQWFKLEGKLTKSELKDAYGDYMLKLLK